MDDTLLHMLLEEAVFYIESMTSRLKDLVNAIHDLQNLQIVRDALCCSWDMLGRWVSESWMLLVTYTFGLKPLAKSEFLTLF